MYFFCKQRHQAKKLDHLLMRYGQSQHSNTQPSENSALQMGDLKPREGNGPVQVPEQLQTTEISSAWGSTTTTGHLSMGLTLKELSEST